MSDQKQVGAQLNEALKNPKLKCLTSDCDKPVSTRGLCATCYQRARRAVAAGHGTWESMEAMNLCLKPTRKKKHPFKPDYGKPCDVTCSGPADEPVFEHDVTCSDGTYEKTGAERTEWEPGMPNKAYEDVDAAELTPETEKNFSKAMIAGRGTGTTPPIDEMPMHRLPESTNTFPGRGVGTMPPIETEGTITPIAGREGAFHYNPPRRMTEPSDLPPLAEDSEDSPAKADEEFLSKFKTMPFVPLAYNQMTEAEVDAAFATKGPMWIAADGRAFAFEGSKDIHNANLARGQFVTQNQGDLQRQALEEEEAKMWETQQNVTRGEGFTMRDLTDDEVKADAEIEAEEMRLADESEARHAANADRERKRQADAQAELDKRGIGFATPIRKKKTDGETPEQTATRRAKETKDAGRILGRLGLGNGKSYTLRRDGDGLLTDRPGDPPLASPDPEPRPDLDNLDEQLTWLAFLLDMNNAATEDTVCRFAREHEMDFEDALHAMISQAERKQEERNRALKERLEAKNQRDLEQYNMELRQKLQADYAELKEQHAKLVSENETLKIEGNLAKVAPIVEKVSLADWAQDLNGHEIFADKQKARLFEEMKKPRDLPAEMCEIFEKADLPELKEVVTFKGQPLEGDVNHEDIVRGKSAENGVYWEPEDPDPAYCSSPGPSREKIDAMKIKMKIEKKMLEEKMRKAMEDTKFEPPLEKPADLIVTDSAKAALETLMEAREKRIKEVGPERAYAEERLREAETEHQRLINELKEMGMDTDDPRPISKAMISGPDEHGKMKFTEIERVDPEAVDPALLPPRQEVIDGIDLGTNPRTEPEPMDSNIKHEVPYIVPKDGSYDALKQAEIDAGLSLSVDGKAFANPVARDRYDAWLKRCEQAGLGMSITALDRKDAASSVAHGIRPAIWPVIADEPVPYETPEGVETEPVPEPVPEPEVPYEVPKVEEADPEATDSEIYRSQAHSMIGKAFGIMPYDPAVKKIVDQCYGVMAKTGRPEKKVLEECVTWARKQGASMNIRPKRNYAPNDPRSRPHPNSREDISFDPALDLPPHMRAVGDPLYVPPVIDD